jgi:hypothetical protein
LGIEYIKNLNDETSEIARHAQENLQKQLIQFYPAYISTSHIKFLLIPVESFKQENDERNCTLVLVLESNLFPDLHPQRFVQDLCKEKWVDSNKLLSKQERIESMG